MTKKKQMARGAVLALLATGTMVATGCTTPATHTHAKLAKHFDLPEWFKAPWSKPKDEAPEPYPNPVKVAATWTPDVLVQTGKTPTRGFGGRLFFFDEKTKAVPVEGTLTVHGFETGPQGKKTKIQPFEFTPEQFTSHFSQSDFGASYSVWIPWDAAGGEQKKISLVPTFKTTEGKFVQGSPTTVILPGHKPASGSAVASGHLSPQYRGHQDAVAHHPTRPSGLVTTTIRRFGTTPDGGNELPSPSLKERVNAIVASQRATADGTTPFIDVPLSKPSESKASYAAKPTRTGVMPVSAEVPSATDQSGPQHLGVQRGDVKPIGKSVSAPRRIKSMINR